MWHQGFFNMVIKFSHVHEPLQMSRTELKEIQYGVKPTLTFVFRIYLMHSNATQWYKPQQLSWLSRKTSKSLWPVTSWADLLFVWKTKPLCWAAARWHSALVSVVTAARRARGRSEHQYVNITAVKWKKCASVPLERYENQVNIKLRNNYSLFPNRRFWNLLVKSILGFRPPAGLKSKTLQCSEQHCWSKVN